ncbi:MAG: hypothetical protein ACE14P_03830 [Methanotrichaceae archaeon]
MDLRYFPWQLLYLIYMGFIPAHLDDMANYIPARLSILFIAYPVLGEQRTHWPLPLEIMAK